MSDVPPKDRDIAMVFQSYALYPTMSVAKNITFGMKVRGVDASTQKAKLEKVAAQLQIEALLERRPAQLSGGQRQRIAMGRARSVIPSCFSLTSHFPAWMPNCGWKCEMKSSCIKASGPRWSMSRMTRSRR